MKITILCYQIPGAVIPQVYQGIRVISVPCVTLLKDQLTMPNYWALANALKRIHQEISIDLILCETRFFESSWWIPFLAKLWGIPAYIIDHCASSPVHPSWIVRFMGKILDRTLVKFCLNLYRAVMVSNRAVENYLQKLGVKNLHFISTGVDSQFFDGPSARSDKSIMITFLSRMVATKGVKIFSQAAERITKKNNQVKVTIGENLTKEEVRDLLLKTDIFVHPSWHHEGIPNVILEAGAAGCAVIASNAGGTGEVIDENTGILLTDLSSQTLVGAMDRLITDKPLRLKLAAKLKEKIRSTYSWRGVTQAVSGLIFT